jgi:UDP-glucose 6-dehydrogenase
MNKTVAIIGNGWVGKAMQKLFPNATVYVRGGAMHGNAMDASGRFIGNYFTDDKDLINTCEVAFVAVPTPNNVGNTVPGATPGTPYWDANEEGEGKLDTSAVEEVIAWCTCPLIVIRSTVNPGDCGRWSAKYKKQIVFQPEYLGETPEHPLLDTIKTNFMILGGTEDNTQALIDLYATVYNANTTIRQVTLLEAEVIKLTENRAIGFKVAQCQELYDVCEKAGLNYYTIRDAVYHDDPRFNLWWSFIYKDKRGFNSKCIPKDIYAWAAFAESLGYEPKITRAMLEKNKEWIGGD